MIPTISYSDNLSIVVVNHYIWYSSSLEPQGLVPVSSCQAPCDSSSQLYLFPTITQRR